MGVSVRLGEREGESLRVGESSRVGESLRVGVRTPWSVHSAGGRVLDPHPQSWHDQITIRHWRPE